MKNSKKKQLRHMERQDAFGISRRKQRRTISYRTYKILKICLTAAIPAVYFLCSPFLIFVIIGWIVLLFFTNAQEKKYNAGLKKELCVKFPKTDSILCILILILTLASVIVSNVSMTSHSSVFSGMTEDEVSSSVGSNFDSVNFVLFGILRKLKDIGSLQTGTRWLFLSEMKFRGGGGGDVSAPPSGGANISDMLSDMPFSMVFESIVKAICTALLVIVCLLALFSFYQLKKLGVETENLSEKERIRRAKKAEQRRRKKNSYRSTKKTDYENLERELLDDLSFLFETQNENEGGDFLQEEEIAEDTKETEETDQLPFDIDGTI